MRNTETTKVFVILGFFFLLLLNASPAFAQKGKQPSKLPERGHIEKSHSEIPLLTHLEEKMQIPMFPDPGLDPMDSVWMDFSIDWTNCQMHRVDDAPIEIILPGTINGSNTLHWNLSAVAPQSGVPPDLYFVEDIMGRTGAVYGSDVPLIWEISLDGGPFTSMTLQPDNTLTTVFPPGQHSFQVRITGALQPYQSDGYYHLQLEQCIVPEL